jgi:hypothetical protein
MHWTIATNQKLFPTWGLLRRKPIEALIAPTIDISGASFMGIMNGVEFVHNICASVIGFLSSWGF